MRVNGTLNRTGTRVGEFTLYRTLKKAPVEGKPLPTPVTSTYKLRNNVIERCQRSPLRKTKADKTGWRNPTGYNRTTLLSKSLGGSVTDYFSNGDVAVWTGEAGTGSTYHPVRFNGLLNSTYKIAVSPNLMIRADTEALVKVKDMKVNYGEALAEARSTIRHLAKTSITLVRAIKFARSGQWHRVAKELGLRKDQVLTGKAPANRWLEYQFGWMPLLGDIKGTMDLLNEGFRKKGFTFSVVRQVQSEGLPLVLTAFDANTNYDGTSKYLCKTKMYCKIRNENLASLTRIGLADPLQVAWALVPFSFVVDWVLPVGSYLEALSATHGVDFISGTRVHRVEFDFVASSQPPINQLNVIKRQGSFRSRHIGVSTQRDVLTKFPLPMLYFKSPFSVSHGVSALALIRSLKR
ncbi:MAG: putative maturation/attachment protein [Cunavirus faecivicinum]|uniref:Maturation/attachment protein n=1 Tax=Leviviridae sp. TaxID=2027243 RepID=A0ABY3ST48_9VIRU|nr:MAG: putative maturation/attachment protein [Leviviridae sp.]